jgi:hypothetical protein
MSTRHRFTIALTLALASGAAAALAGDPKDTRGPGAGWHAVRDDVPVTPRDLVPQPAPGKPGSGAAKRPAVTLRPSSPVVQVGAPIGFEVGSSVAGFGHLYVLSASGRVQVWMENVPIAAGQRLVFPTGSMGIKAAAPAGREDIMLVVTRTRIDGFFGQETMRWPRQLPYDHGAFKQALSAKFLERPQHEWGFARTTVQVVERSPPDPTWGWGAGAADLWAGQGETD